MAVKEGARARVSEGVNDAVEAGGIIEVGAVVDVEACVASSDCSGVTVAGVPGFCRGESWVKIIRQQQRTNSKGMKVTILAIGPDFQNVEKVLMMPFPAEIMEDG